MAKQHPTSEAAAREAQQALRALANAVHSGARDGDFPKKLRKALREVEPLIERADRKLGKRQAKLMKAARLEREKRAAEQAKAAGPRPKTAGQAAGRGARQEGPGTTPRTAIAGERARKRARRGS